jgi:hypothetical protein
VAEGAVARGIATTKALHGREWNSQRETVIFGGEFHVATVIPFKGDRRVSPIPRLQNRSARGQGAHADEGEPAKPFKSQLHHVDCLKRSPSVMLTIRYGEPSPATMVGVANPRNG